MRFERTEAFKRDFQRLSPPMRNRLVRQLALLGTNRGHPSLRLKKLEGTDYWEARLTEGYRITMQFIDDIVILRRVGPNDILRRP